MTLYCAGLEVGEIEACRKMWGGKVSFSDGSESLVEEWRRKAGDLTSTDDEEDKVVVGGATPACLRTIMYALYRRQVPVLSLELKAGDLEGSELLETKGDGETRVAAVERFLTPPATPGRIFTIEGGDGAGKQTQSQMLVERLRDSGFPVKTLDFPRDDALYGKKIREILSGKHGSISEVSPLLFATVYSFNRDDLRPTLKYWLSRGYNVVLDRYMESSYGHQAAKLENDAEREAMIKKLEAFETKWLGIPPSHKVLYLDLDPRAALAAMQTDGTRKTLDIHETAKSTYKEQVRSCFRWCCTSFDHWQDMPQQTAEGLRKSREEAHRDIWKALEAEFVNRRA